MELLTAEEIRSLDRAAIDDLGIPGVVLMESAGKGVAGVVADLLVPAGAAVVVLSGRGNNGGDGFVAARRLADMGASVQIFVFAEATRIGGDAAVNLHIAQNLGMEILFVPEETRLDVLDSALAEADCIIDALLGTGLNQDVGGIYAKVIEAANAAEAIKIAVDIPSGIHADSGAVLGTAFKADATVTFGMPKIGLISYPGAQYAGDVFLVDIGIPAQCRSRIRPSAFLLDESTAAAPILPRTMGGHKGTYGHALMIAGSHGKTGAAILCGKAAARAGAGLVTLAVPQDVQHVLEASVTELMTASYAPKSDGIQPERAAEELAALADGKECLAIGPGIPTCAEMAATLKLLVSSPAMAKKCLILDADGLNLLADSLEIINACPCQVLLTPHPGEAARLLGTTTAEVQADRVQAARTLATRTGAVVALKGARTVIATPEGSIWINPTGNPGMGTGGTGDVLTGILAGFVVQGIDVLSAARSGVYAHGKAGDLAAEEMGQASLTAGDILAKLPEVLRAWEQGRLEEEDDEGASQTR